jgi:hypothetical protein
MAQHRPIVIDYLQRSCEYLLLLHERAVHVAHAHHRCHFAFKSAAAILHKLASEALVLRVVQRLRTRPRACDHDSFSLCFL